MEPLSMLLLLNALSLFDWEKIYFPAPLTMCLCMAVSASVCVCTERRLSWIVSVIFPFNLLTFPGDTFRNFWLSHSLGLRFCFETRSIACAFFCPVTLSPFAPHSMENVWVARHRTWKGKTGKSARNDNGRSIHANRMPIIGNRVPAYLHFFFAPSSPYRFYRSFLTF